MISKHKRLNMYCKDDISKIENYYNAVTDTEQVWDCHHRLEFTLDGETAHTKDELIRMGMQNSEKYKQWRRKKILEKIAKLYDELNSIV